MTPNEFKIACRKFFSFLIENYNFREEPLPKEKYINEFQVRFITAKTRISIEGINWGFNIDIRISSINPDEMKHKSYCFNDLLALRNAKVEYPEPRGKTLSGEIQIKQMQAYATALKKYAEDILQDDHTIFPSLAECIDKRVIEFKKEQKNC